MDLKFTSLHQIDHHLNNIEEIDISTQSQDLKNYTNRLITEITEGTSKRKFEFRRETTEVRNIIGQFLNSMYVGKETNAQRLLGVEEEAQKGIEHLGIEIQKGSLFQAHLENDEEHIVVISKADQISFLAEDDFTLKSGLPWDKKIFKAFLARFNNQRQVTETFVYDTTPRMARYWWDKYLELDEVYTPEFNTKTALKLLDSKVLNHIKKKYKADHTAIRNKAVGYFQSRETFELNGFLETILNNYDPVDPEFPKTQTIEKVRNLPEKFNFDSQFPIAPEEVTSRKVKNKINLTDRMDLILRENIPELESTVQSFRDDEQRKWIAIRTDTGFDHFQGNERTFSDNE